jgi:hypothetical protein
MYRWSDRRQPRPNVKIYSLDAYHLPRRLRGDDERADEMPEAVVVYVLAGFIVWTIVALILVAA